MNLLPNWLYPHLDRLLQQRERLHHALLFVGPEGIGKDWLARALAAALLCDAPTAGGRACGACAACRWLSQDTHPDFRVVRPSADEPVAAEGDAPAARAAKPSRDIRIEQIRALSSFVEIASHRGGEKIVLVTPAEAMNGASANALLKTLEEPPPNTRFLLVSSRPDRLPATVRSRCRTLPVPTPSADEALAWVAAQTGSDTTRAQEWLAFCGGAPRRAAELGDADRAGLHRALTELFAQGAAGDLAGVAERISGYEARDWVPALHAWCVDLARCAAGASPRYFPSESGRLGSLASRLDRRALLEFEQWLTSLGRLVSHPLNARLLAEDAFTRYRSLLAAG